MTKSAPLLVGPLALVCGLAGCGHRADPLPPLRKTPPAPASFRLAQRGDRIELQAAAPGVSVDGLAYQALAVEFLHGDERVDLEKRGRRVQVPAAAGALATTSLPLPPPGSWVRASARAVVHGERGPRTLTSALVAQPPLETPTRLDATVSENGIELRWRGPRPAAIAPPPVQTLPFAAKSPVATGQPAGTAPLPAAGRAATAGQAPTAGQPSSPSPSAAAAASTAEPPAPASEPQAAPAEKPAGEGPPAPPAAVPAPPTVVPGQPAVEGALAPPSAAADRTPAAPAPPTAQKPGPPGAPVTVTPPPAPPPRRNGFFVYRRTASEPYSTPLVPEPTDRHAMTDPSVPHGLQVCYVVRAVGSPEPLIESAASNEVCLERKDVVAPEAPKGLAALPRPGAIELLWSPSNDEDLTAYRVYRAEGDQQPERVAELALGKTAWLDESVKPGTRYRYTLTAVDRSGNESAAGEPVEASLP